MSHPLRALLKKQKVWNWDNAQEIAFQQIRKDISRNRTLAKFDPSLKTVFGIGATLYQIQINGAKQLVSRSLTCVESNYACIERECLRITWALEKFRMYIKGINIHIETDHKPFIPKSKINLVSDNELQINSDMNRVELEAIEIAQCKYIVCKSVYNYINVGWPRYLSIVDSLIKTYWEQRGDLAIVNG